MELQSFGHWLRLKRKSLDLTREGLAQRVGYSAATIRKIEDEERHPSAQMIARLAEIFQIPAEDQAAFSRFGRGERLAASAEIVEETPWHVSEKHLRSNLPTALTSLVGRTREIDDIHNYLSSDIRLVTLVGPPGIGKTRLSLEAARVALTGFPEGVFFVALAPLNDAGLIAPAIAQALGYVGGRNISTIEQLKEGIGEKHVLLVLDNCEHLIEAVASLTSEILSACPHLKILATSRESLRVAGEWLYTVPAFDIPAESSSLDMDNISAYPVLALFVERARAVRSDFSLNADNFQTITAICARLDGLPLVIELIAARMRLMSPQSLLDRLSSQFILTADGMRAASERQKTLQHAIDWSYNLLPPEEQKLFVYLSVFSGGFTLEAVEAMLSQKLSQRPVPALIALLLDKSLLKLASQADDQTRYTMLVTIQEYAQERLQEMGEEAEIRNLHLAYFLEVADQGGKEMRGQNQIAWLHSLLGMRDNLRVALDWAIETRQTEVALRMVQRLHWFWFVHSDHNEARRSFERVLSMHDPQMYPELQAEVLTQWAHHLWTQIGAEDALPLVERALTIARDRDDKLNIARALTIRGLALVTQRNFVEAQATLEESKALFQELHDDWEYTHTVMSLALCADKQNDLAASLSLHEQALTLFRKVGDLYFQSFALGFIGILLVKKGDIKRGMNALQEALILSRQLDSKHGMAGAMSRLAAVAQRTGEHARSVHLYWAARLIWDSIGTWGDENEVDFESWIAPSRSALGKVDFAQAEAQGRSMSMEEAIAYALEYSDE